MDEMTEPLLPIAKPLLFCHDVLSDPDTGNVHLIGVFDAIRPQSQPPFPHRHGQFAVFVELTDAAGVVPARLDVVEAQSGELIFRTADHRLVFRNRQAILRALFRLQNCRFSRPGVYWVQFFCHNRFITDKALHLLQPGE
jgi:hypothetical protein